MLNSFKMSKKNFVVEQKPVVVCKDVKEINKVTYYTNEKHDFLL